MWPWRHWVHLPQETAASCLQSDSLRNKASPVQGKETNLIARSAGRVSCIQGTKKQNKKKKELLISVRIQWDNMRQHLKVKSTLYFYVQTSQGPIPQDISNPGARKKTCLSLQLFWWNAVSLRRYNFLRQRKFRIYMQTDQQCFHHQRKE